MPNPGAFKGARKEFLITQKEEYAQAVEANHVAETLMNINRRFFKRFPLTMPADYEPTKEVLDAVDDDAPEPDVPEPNRETMSQVEFDKVAAEVKTRNSLRDSIAGQIKRWFAYQYNKEHHPKKLSESTLLSLLQKLAGKDTTRLRMKSDVNTWRKSQRDAIDSQYEAEVARALARGEPMKKSNKATDRDRIAREMFAALPKMEQEMWRKKSEEEHAAAMAVYQASWSPSKSPADRQRAINSLVKVMEPILDVASETTGWKLMLVAGGPEPAKGGDLSVITMHAGETPGDIKMNLGQTERNKFKNYMIPLFGSFLHKCYTPDECRSRALPKDGADGLVSSASLQNQSENTTVHSMPLRAAPTEVAPAIENSRVPEVVHEPASTNAGVNDDTHSDTDNPFPVDHLPASPQLSLCASRQPSPCVSHAVSPDFTALPARVLAPSTTSGSAPMPDGIPNAEPRVRTAAEKPLPSTALSAAAQPTVESSAKPAAESSGPSVVPTTLQAQSALPSMVPLSAPAASFVNAQVSVPPVPTPSVVPPVASKGKASKKKAKRANDVNVV